MTDQQQPPYAPYGGAAYGGSPYGGAPLAPRTNTLAVVAFVLAFVVSIGAVVCGHIALVQIRRTGEGGRLLAIWALVLGYAGIALTVLSIIGFIVLLAVAHTTGGTTGSVYG